MATRRSQIQVEVLGLDDLRNLNTALGAHDRRLQNLTQTYLQFAGAVNAANPGLQRLGNTFVTVNNTVNNVNRSINTTNNQIINLGNNANNAGGHFGNLFARMIQYRAVSLVFEGVTKAIGATVQAMYEMEKQAARVQRVSAPGSTPVIRADVAEEAARTGADIKDIGEAYYQLKTQIKDNATAFGALQTAMNLVVGTEADARQTTRAMLQIYNQFGSQLDKNVGQAENFRRIGELLAITWKGADAEMIDITNALKYLGPIAEAARVPLAQVTATISALTEEGHRGRMGGTEAGQFIAQIIKNYNAASGMIENKGAKVKIGLTAEGGIDLQKTLQNIVDTANRMPLTQARSFLLAISGSQNSFRFLGTTGADFMRMLTQKIEESTRALHGQTAEANELRKTMTTTAVEWDRAWKGMFALVANLVDTSPVRGWLHDINVQLQQWLDAARQAQGWIGGQQSYRERVYSGGAPVRDQVELTQETVRKALANLRAAHRAPVGASLFAGSQLDIATAGMTPADRAMIRHRYLPSGNTLQNLNEEQMATDLATMLRQTNNPNFGRPTGPLLPMAVHPGAPLPPSQGSYHDPKIDKAEKDADKAADKAARERVEVAKQMAEHASVLYQDALKRFGPDDRRTVTAAQTSRLLAENAAKTDTDENERLRLRLGLSGDEADRLDKSQTAAKKRADEQEKSDKEAAKTHADATAYYAESAQKKYGIFAPITEQRAKEAQEAAIAAAKSDEDLVLSWKLLAGVEGPLFDFTEKRKEEARKLYSSEGVVQTSIFPIPQEAIDHFRNRPDVQAGVNTATRQKEDAQFQQEKKVRDLVEASDASVRALERGARPNAPFGGADARQESILQGSIARISDTLHALEAIPKPIDATTKEIEKMQDRLADANAALIDFRDTLAEKAQAKLFSDVADKYGRQLSDLENRNLPGVGETPRQAERRERQLLLNKLDFANRQYQEVAGLAALTTGFPFGGDQSDKTKKEIENADIARKQAEMAVAVFDRTRAVERYASVHDPIAGNAQNTVLGFLRGQGDVGDLFKGLGGEIVNAALAPWTKKLTDPLVNATTSQILALQKNTDALGALTGTMNGTGGGSFAGTIQTAGPQIGKSLGGAAAVAAAAALAGGSWASVGADASAKTGNSVGKNANRGRTGPSDLEKGIGAGLGAYAIGATSAQQGVNAGNFLGGILSGASIGSTFGPGGGLIGGIIGGAVDLIGGLFHHASKPTEQPRDLNPALYNAPAGFDLAAYNYSAYGKLPTVQDVGFDVSQPNTPTINVFVDGAAVAARKEIARQTSSVSVNLVNTRMDRHTPI